MAVPSSDQNQTMTTVAPMMAQNQTNIRAAPPGSASAKFPAEIWLLIASQFCPHCQLGDECHLVLNRAQCMARRATLMNLALACRKTQSVAQEHLFHHVPFSQIMFPLHPGSGSVNFTVGNRNRLDLLQQTLREFPAIAEKIRVLQLDPSTWNTVRSRQKLEVLAQWLRCQAQDPRVLWRWYNEHFPLDMRECLFTIHNPTVGFTTRHLKHLLRCYPTITHFAYWPSTRLKGPNRRYWIDYFDPHFEPQIDPTWTDEEITAYHVLHRPPIPAYFEVFQPVLPNLNSLLIESAGPFDGTSSLSPLFGFSPSLKELYLGANAHFHNRDVPPELQPALNPNAVVTIPPALGLFLVLPEFLEHLCIFGLNMELPSADHARYELRQLSDAVSVDMIKELRKLTIRPIVMKRTTTFKTNERSYVLDRNLAVEGRKTWVEMETGGLKSWFEGTGVEVVVELDWETDEWARKRMWVDWGLAEANRENEDGWAEMED
ncbi:hypothetical protein QBC34DRAFT_497114 [Podospora aff. communis PSN243]|uniref:F-box domain-containing protein n=1 Tax=Podospora aff. communis PSN243 TaxID=3040156 RepID=A0AAV9GDL0_9PEZI|nr:hypothetical protein QBC34DRAFT_497114 [Podospora aff. communis PSN243]